MRRQTQAAKSGQGRGAQSKTANRRAKLQPRTGAIVVQAALMLVIVMCFAALTIDVGFVSNVRTELQRSADAGALAGAGRLIDGADVAIGEARRFAEIDRCAGRRLTDSEVIVETGRWDLKSRIFQAGASPSDAVRVTTVEQGVPLFFAGIMGRKSTAARASAIATYQPRDIQLVLDFSGSMNDENKVASLKESVRVFVAFLRSTPNKDRVGFVRYSTTASLKQKLTFNLENLDRDVQRENADGWTNVGDAMFLGREELEHNGRAQAKKMMVLMTDGIANRPLDRNPADYVRSEAYKAAAAKIPIVSISFGSDADQSLMQEVADITGSTHFHVGGWYASMEDELKTVFRKVAANRPLTLVD